MLAAYRRAKPFTLPTTTTTHDNKYTTSPSAAHLSHSRGRSRARCRPSHAPPLPPTTDSPCSFFKSPLPVVTAPLSHTPQLHSTAVSLYPDPYLDNDNWHLFLSRCCSRPPLAHTHSRTHAPPPTTACLLFSCYYCRRASPSRTRASARAPTLRSSLAPPAQPQRKERAVVFSVVVADSLCRARRPSHTRPRTPTTTNSAVLGRPLRLCCEPLRPRRQHQPLFFPSSTAGCGPSAATCPTPYTITSRLYSFLAPVPRRASTVDKIHPKKNLFVFHALSPISSATTGHQHQFWRGSPFLFF